VAIANDRLFLFFAACAAFSGLFLLIAAMSGALHGHGHSGHLGHLDHGGHGSHGLHASHGPDGGHAGDGTGAHHGLHSGKAGPHLHAGKADLHLETGKHGHHGHTDHSGQDLQTGKAGHGPHSDAQGHHADHGGHGAHVGHLGHHGAQMFMAHLHTLWSGFTSLLVRSLNVYGILTFLFYFGIAGMLVRSDTKLPPGLALLLPPLIGATAALTCNAILARLFGDTSGLVTRENSQLEGREVKVTWAIRSGGTGEVIYTPQGGAVQNIPARSKDGQRIPAGQVVVVADVHGGIAIVERLRSLSDAVDGEDASSGEDNEPPSEPASLR
jgi:membrane protein implicated in regulation of membrane protease activity